MKGNLTNNEIIAEVELAFDQLVAWSNKYSQDQFNQEFYKDKWTPAQHVYHLIKTTKAVYKGFEKARFLLWWMFGKNNRQERSYEETVYKYKSVLKRSNVKVPKKFSSDAGRIFDKDQLISRFLREKQSFIRAYKGWNELSASKYIMPHPVIGKMTIREFGYFTILHTYHHLDILKEKYKL